MEETLSVLEGTRSGLLGQISRLGDLRPGSVVEFMACCSKPNCHYVQPHDPGHGPHFRFYPQGKGQDGPRDGV